MTLYTPLWMQPQAGDPDIEYSALTDRQLVLSLWDTEGPVFGLQVSQRAAGANMSVDISGGQAIITGNDASPQGTYFVSSDETENRTIPAPPASGTRIHRVVAWVRDKLYDGTQTTYDWVLEVLEDTGSGTPDPAPSAITLATVSVSAGQISVTDADITDLRLHALSRPGRARLTADASERPANPALAERLFRTDLDDEEVWTGSKWLVVGLNRPYAILTANSDQSVVTATSVPVAFNTEIADSHGGHDTSTNNSRYTVQQAGVYQVNAVVSYANNTADGKFEIIFRVNSVDSWAGGSAWKGTDNITTIVQGAALLRLDEGDYVEVIVWQGTGSTLTIDSGFYGGQRFEVMWVRSQ